ncbi:MAG: hypothetical protein ACLRNW_12945 [Neglectibacter sp.]
MNNEFLPAYKVYQQVIDLELYYAFVDLVVHTSQEEKAWEIYRNIVDTQIWQQKAEGQNYFEAYNLRYPGEVLERFEEKLGKDVRIIRALALALGKTRALQSDNMFVGNQRGSFLQTVRRTSNGDVYLQGALYLLETDMPRRHALLDELAATEYAKTEDALFVLSLFDDQEEGTALCTASFSDCWGKNARFPCLKTAACWNGWSSIMLRISSRIAESQILFCEH